MTMKKKRIALIGYRGSGKSTVAKLLAKRLGWELLELDRLIDEQAGAKIPEIVAKFGWEKFRELETGLLAECLKKEPAVLDLGGGVVEKEANRKLISENTAVVWLQARPEVLMDRIQGYAHRPSLTGKSIVDEVPEVLARRTPLYESLAQLTVDTETNSPEAAVDLIVKSLGLGK